MQMSIDRFAWAIPDYLPLGENCWLAGGFFRSILSDETVNDYDLFFSNPVSADEIKKHLLGEGLNIVYECPLGKLTTFKEPESVAKVQLITEFFYPSMASCIETFDISACRYISDGKVVVTAYSAVRDTLKKQINLHRFDYPVATMLRIAKYSRYGYRLTSKAASKFVTEVYSRGETLSGIDARVYID